ncbi:type I restriction endonuclease [Haloglycomyces albus]|uniref:type I restriction endonuclease n=1 Tax=Haloglycomyces albus TaxID=526067 RepID=UPI003CCBB08E
MESLSEKIKTQAGSVTTEEAAKNAFIMPFISNVLGYDVFNPNEVIPEFTADVGLKKGEKIDYAIVRDDDVQILIECKKSNQALTLENASQLYRYFSVTQARIAVLTNGIEYQFYTDLDSPNRMDSKPFLVLDLSDIDETLLPELKKLTKEFFDLNSVINAAEELKYLGQIKKLLATQFNEPSDDWIRFFTTPVYDGSFTQKVKEQFRPLVRKAATQFLNEQVNDRLKAALEPRGEDPSTSPAENAEPESSYDENDTDNGIVTTTEELNGYQIVRAVVCSEVAINRITYRDAKSYFAILLDDNNRKTIARLHFNSKSRKNIGTFDEDKNETRYQISSLEDIYLHAETLRKTVRRYLD